MIEDKKIVEFKETNFQPTEKKYVVSEKLYSRLPVLKANLVLKNG